MCAGCEKYFKTVIWVVQEPKLSIKQLKLASFLGDAILNKTNKEKTWLYHHSSQL